MMGLVGRMPFQYSLPQHCSSDNMHRSQKSATVEQQLMDQNAKSKEFIQTFRGEVTQGQGNAIQALEQFKHDL